MEKDKKIIMKREFWRKAPQCAKCIYHCPEGPRPDSIDPHTIWKEACRSYGYSFWQELVEAEICFDYKTDQIIHDVEDQKEKDSWAKIHLCSSCAFYEMNGYELCDKSIVGNQAEWDALHRCHGYIWNDEVEPEGNCLSYLSLEQWAIVEGTPIKEGERIRVWEKFRAENLSDKNLL